MPGFSRISPEQAVALLDAEAEFVDIRDLQSFGQSHIAGATHLCNETLQDYIAQANKSRPLVVYCYHGNSSQNAAQFFCDQGFNEVMSMDGGFEAWRQAYPVTGQN